RLQFTVMMAEGGDLEAGDSLANLLYWGGRGFDRDHGRALKLWDGVGVERVRERMRKRKRERKRKRKSASDDDDDEDSDDEDAAVGWWGDGLGSSEASHVMSGLCGAASMFVRGEGTEANVTAAVERYAHAIDLGRKRGLRGAEEGEEGNPLLLSGYAQALNGIGYAYFNGAGPLLPRNESKAYEYFLEGASLLVPDGDACANAAVCLGSGSGVGKNVEEATRMYKRAARAGSLQGAYESGKREENLGWWGGGGDDRGTGQEEDSMSITTKLMDKIENAVKYYLVKRDGGVILGLHNFEQTLGKVWIWENLALAALAVGLVVVGVRGWLKVFL
ncbi:hypothetical protein ScalyP_jg287, partial [Parmales sp. scaly parma]